MADIKFSTEEKQVIVHKLKRYFSKELDFEIGQFDCEFLLDFISEEFGAHYYNKGLNDAKIVINKKIEDIGFEIDELEQEVKQL